MTTKNGQTKASPIESEIHPSHKTPFYALCISRLHRARRDCSQAHLARAAYPRGYAPRIALAGGRHLRKSASKRCSFSPAPMAFPYPFFLPSDVAAGKRIRKNHTRPASFCTNHLASCFDDSAKGAHASSARERAYARNRSPKVALAGKPMTAVRNTN